MNKNEKVDHCSSREKTVYVYVHKAPTSKNNLYIEVHFERLSLKVCGKKRIRLKGYIDLWHMTCQFIVEIRVFFLLSFPSVAFGSPSLWQYKVTYIYNMDAQCAPLYHSVQKNFIKYGQRRLKFFNDFIIVDSTVLNEQRYKIVL